MKNALKLLTSAILSVVILASVVQAGWVFYFVALRNVNIPDLVSPNSQGYYVFPMSWQVENLAGINQYVYRKVYYRLNGDTRNFPITQCARTTWFSPLTLLVFDSCNNATLPSNPGAHYDVCVVASLNAITENTSTWPVSSCDMVSLQ